MSMKEIKVTKNPIPVPIFRAVEGDDATQDVKFRIRKADYNATLSDCRWFVHVRTPIGGNYTLHCNNPVTDGDDYVLTWTVDGKACEACGHTFIEIVAKTEYPDGSKHVWKSGVMIIDVIRSMGDMPDWIPPEINIEGDESTPPPTPPIVEVVS